MGNDLSLVRRLFHACPESNQLIIHAGGLMWAVREVRVQSVVVSPVKHLKIDTERFEYETFTVGNYWYMPDGPEIQLGRPVLEVSEDGNEDG